jgi:hypothetical protein
MTFDDNKYSTLNYASVAVYVAEIARQKQLKWLKLTENEDLNSNLTNAFFVTNARRVAREMPLKARFSTS